MWCGPCIRHIFGLCQVSFFLFCFCLHIKFSNHGKIYFFIDTAQITTLISVEKTVCVLWLNLHYVCYLFVKHCFDWESVCKTKNFSETAPFKSILYSVLISALFIIKMDAMTGCLYLFVYSKSVSEKVHWNAKWRSSLHELIKLEFSESGLNECMEFVSEENINKQASAWEAVILIFFK